MLCNDYVKQGIKDRCPYFLYTKYKLYYKVHSQYRIMKQSGRHVSNKQTYSQQVMYMLT